MSSHNYDIKNITKHVNRYGFVLPDGVPPQPRRGDTICIVADDLVNASPSRASRSRSIQKKDFDLVKLFVLI